MSDIVSSIRHALLNTVDMKRRYIIGGSDIEDALQPCILAHTLVPSEVTREYLADLADLIVESGRGDLLEAVYGALGETPSTDDLVTCGQAAIERGDIPIGIALFKKAGIPVPRPRLREIMLRALAERQYLRACDAATAAGDPLPVQELRQLAEADLTAGNWLVGCQGFVLGNGGRCELPLELLQKCAAAAVKNGDFSTLDHVYRQPGMTDAPGDVFLQCADAAMRHSSKLPAAFAAINEALNRNVSGAGEKMIAFVEAAIACMQWPIAVAGCARIDWAVPDSIILELAKFELDYRRYDRASELLHRILARQK